MRRDMFEDTDARDHVKFLTNAGIGNIVWFDFEMSVAETAGPVAGDFIDGGHLDSAILNQVRKGCFTGTNNSLARSFLRLSGYLFSL